MKIIDLDANDFHRNLHHLSIQQHPRLRLAIHTRRSKDLVQKGHVPGKAVQSAFDASSGVLSHQIETSP